MPDPLILAIDTSCDETCASVSFGRRILSNVISSQINIHQKYGGVVPHLAKRAHQEKIESVVKEALKRSHTSPRQLNTIAVTLGPGLAPALEVGISFAKNLARRLKLPLITVNHMEGHLLSALALPNTSEVKSSNTSEVKFPAIGLLVSGGHTQLVLVKSIGLYQLLGETLDDAAGEALDKLAKMLKLGYPGGPIIEQLAKQSAGWRTSTIPLPVPLQHSQDLNFSFSGLKTAAMYIIQRHTSEVKSSNTSEVKFVYDLCASFQQAIAKSLTVKLQKAIEQFSPKIILLGGGVFSNLYFRRQIRSAVKPFQLPLYLPYSKKLFTDNAAMIAVPAYFKFLKKDFVKNIKTLDRQPNLNFDTI